MIALTRGIGQSWLSLTNKLSGGDVIISSFYVRPAGTTYGAGDGSSYENAWSGFSAIDWEQLGSHTRLYVCGTHNESLDVKASGITIQGDYEGDPGAIDGQNMVNQCFKVLVNNVTINHMSFINGVIDCAYSGGTGIVYNYCTGSGSGNQAFQNEGTGYHVTYNFCTASDNFDDGISLHGEGTVIANDCVLTGNGQGVHGIASGFFTANRCTFTNNTQDLNSSIDTTFVVNDSIFSSQIFSGSSNPLTINSCVWTSGEVYCAASRILILNKCSFLGDSYVLSHGDTRINYSKFESLTSYQVQSRNTGKVSVYYSVFNLSNGSFGFWANGAGEDIIYNCTFWGNGTGRAIYFNKNISVKNSIFANLTFAYQGTGAATLTDDHCNLHAASTNNITIVRNQPVVGDPLLSDPANNNFSLGFGSSCIDTGLDTGFPVGIDTANWGDSENTPVVSTKLQGENYDIGAYC